MASTLIQVFYETVARHPRPDLFMRKVDGRWESLSTERAQSDVESLGLALRELGVTRGDRVGLLSENRYEWPLTDLAVLGLGAVTVPIYPTLTAEQCRFILDNAECGVVVVSGNAQLQKLHTIAGRLPALRTVVYMDPVAEPAAIDRDLRALLKRGAELRAAGPGAFRQLASEVKPDDLATIIYTSGTTGEPKGAKISHWNILFDVQSCLKRVPLETSDRALSFLPLCHIFERMAGLYALLHQGMSIAYAQSIDTVAADAVDVHPTIINGVPRFYEKVFARVMENAAKEPPLRRAIFHWGLEQGRRRARAHFERRSLAPHQALAAAIADRLVGVKVRERVGGKLRLCISGGAPLAPKVIEFFFAIGITVLEGYGLTETSPVICLNPPGREKPGSVGPPIEGVEVKLGDEDEILTRGPHIMSGYFRNDEATKVALRDGWFHTGDVGRFDDEGYLFITDRLKDLLVTSGGKKVAPQPIEAKLKTSKWISEAVLLGDRRPYVVALLVPNFANLEAEARSRGWAFATSHDLIARPETTALYQAEVDRANQGLAHFETIKRFALLDRELNAEAGELTPTLKVRRRIISERFSDMIQNLYSGPPARPS